jgi:hypothetical protein
MDVVGLRNALHCLASITPGDRFLALMMRQLWLAAEYLHPRPVARAAVRHNAGGNLNGGVNRVGMRR